MYVYIHVCAGKVPHVPLWHTVRRGHWYSALQCFALFPWDRACHWTWSSPHLSQSGSEAMPMNPISLFFRAAVTSPCGHGWPLSFPFFFFFWFWWWWFGMRIHTQAHGSQHSHPLRFLVQQPPGSGLLGPVLPHPGWVFLLIFILLYFIYSILLYFHFTVMCFYYIWIIISIVILIYFCFFNTFPLHIRKLKVFPSEDQQTH